MERLRVDLADPHLLSDSSGKRVFLLGDTAWQLLQRLSRDEILFYLDNRAKKGFNLIATVFLPEFDGLRVPNVEGEVPLLEMDPKRLNPRYLDLVRFLLSKAEERGIYVGLLPTWGDKLTAPWGTGPRIFEIGDENLCRDFGYRLSMALATAKNTLWILGGDRPVELSKIPSDWPHPWEAGFTPETNWEPMWQSMSEGISSASPEALFAYHPQGGSNSTSQLMPESKWLDINMMQSGHGGGHDVPVWDWIERDYNAVPAKPTLDAEPNYEDHPVNPWPTWDPSNGYFNDYDVRKQCYRSVFSGGCGVIYGHHCVWQFWSKGKEPIMWPQFEWEDALDRPGAFHVGLLKRLVDRFGLRARIPDTEIFPQGAGQGSSRKACLRSLDGELALIYSPIAEPFSIKVPLHPGARTKLTWIDPLDLSERTEPVRRQPGELIEASPPQLGGSDIVLELIAD